MFKASTVVTLVMLGLSASGAAAAPPLTFGETSPWRFSVTEDIKTMFSRQSLTILGIGGLATAGALAVEDPVRQERSAENLRAVPDIGNAYGDWRTVVGGSAAVTAFGLIAQQPKFTTAGVDLIRAYVYSAGATTLLKYTVDRTRPDGEQYSFPSGHTSAAFSTAPVLAHHFGPWVGAAAYGLAIAAGIGRMEDNKHYLSDVVFGATLGYVAGRGVVHQRRLNDSFLKLEADRVGFQVRF